MTWETWLIIIFALIGATNVIVVLIRAIIVLTKYLKRQP